MTKTRRTLYAIGSIAGAVALAWLVIGTITTVDAGDISAQAAGKERIGWAIIKKLDVEKGGATFDSDITTSGDVSAVNVTASGSTTTTGDLTVSGLTLPSSITTVITDGDTITATVTTHALTNTVASTITLAAAGTNGQELRLVALTTNEITIADTNIRTPDGGTITMTQFYVIGLVSWDSEWLMQYRSTNQ